MFPASPLTLRYFCCSLASQVSYKTIKVYLSGICLEHLERGLQDPTKDELLQLLCTGIKRSQGNTKHTQLPITINILRTLKSQLRNDSSYSLVEKRVLNVDNLTVFIPQSKTDPFRQGHTITQIHPPTPSEPSVCMLQKSYCSNNVGLYSMQADSPHLADSNLQQHSAKHRMQPATLCKS